MPPYAGVSHTSHNCMETQTYNNNDRDKSME